VQLVVYPATFRKRNGIVVVFADGEGTVDGTNQ
jgi:hypothetical protein